MATVGTVRINSVVNNRGLRKGLDEGRSALGSFVGAVTAGSGKIVAGFGAIGLAVQGVRSIVGGIKSIVGGPLQLAAAAQSTAVSFEVLTGSAEEGKRVVSDLQKQAARTPYAFSALTGATQTLLSFGMESANVTEQVSNLSEIAEGQESKLDTLSTAYGKAAATGKLTGGVVQSMITAGFNPLINITKKTGESMEEVQRRMGQGKVSFDELKGSVEMATSVGGQYYQMNLKQSQTLGGAWSTMNDNITLVLTEIGQGIAETFDLTGSLGRVSDFVSGTIPLIQSWMEYFKGIFVALKPIQEQFWNVMVARFTMFYEQTAAVFSGVMGFVSQFLPTWETFRDSILTGLIAAEVGFSNWRKISELTVSQVIASVLGFAGEIAHTFTVVIPSYLSYLFDNWRHVLGEIGRVGQLIFGNFANNVVNIITSIPDLLRGKVSFSDLWTPLTDEATLQFKKLPDIPERVMGDLERSMRDNVASLSDELGSSFAELHKQRMGELIGDKPAQIVPELNKPALSNTVEEVKSNLGEALGEIKLADAAGYGTQEARSAILRSQLSVPSETNTQKELNQINKDQLSVQRETLRVMKSSKREESVVAI